MTVDIFPPNRETAEWGPRILIYVKRDTQVFSGSSCPGKCKQMLAFFFPSSLPPLFLSYLVNP